MSDEIVLTTNWGMRKQHLAWSSSLREVHGGRVGHPLCTRNYKTWDQAYKDDQRVRCELPLGPRIPDLPMCSRCAQKDPRPEVES